MALEVKGCHSALMKTTLDSGCQFLGAACRWERGKQRKNGQLCFDRETSRSDLFRR